MLRSIIKPALIMLGLFTITTGLIYPVLITGIAQWIFPNQANGSLIYAANGSPAGSALIGQNFNEPGYFWGRLSATAEKPYNASSSGGSNFSVLNDNLKDQAQARINALKAADPDNPLPIPVDLVTASGSGLDPHISPASAYVQSPRIARARGLAVEKINELINRHIEQPTLGVFGEPRVNVLLLNLALDKLQ
ncbi:MAG: potassium-transporting ATPase subunit KdpC [Anaerolineaceae bacterium]